MNQEKELKKFFAANQERLNPFFQTFQTVFNDCGEQYKSGKMQAAFTGLIMAALLQSSNMNKIDAENACKIAVSTIKNK